jgi:hypothetical protein
MPVTDTERSYESAKTAPMNTSEPAHAENASGDRRGDVEIGRDRREFRREDENGCRGAARHRNSVPPIARRWLVTR